MNPEAASPLMASVPCECGEKIPTPLNALLGGATVTCWNCGARLTLNREASQDSLDALRQFRDRVNQVKNGVPR